MKLTLIRIFLLSAVTSLAAAQTTLEAWQLPAPDDLIKASNALCVDQAKSALLAWRYKSQGRSKPDVLALLPESPKALSLRLVSVMRENIEDAYEFPDLSQFTYYSFRSESCLRETLEAIRMPRLAANYPRIVECQKKHGGEKSAALFQCVQTVVRAIEVK